MSKNGPPPTYGSGSKPCVLDPNTFTPIYAGSNSYAGGYGGGGGNYAGGYGGGGGNYAGGNGYVGGAGGSNGPAKPPPPPPNSNYFQGGAFEKEFQQHSAEGKAARLGGQPKSSNPHKLVVWREAWDTGWVQQDWVLKETGSFISAKQTPMPDDNGDTRALALDD